MGADLPPGLILILGAALLPLLPRGVLRKLYLLALPAIALTIVLQLEPGSFGIARLFGYEIVHMRIDPLARVFGIIFSVAALLVMIYGLHADDLAEQASALVYMGAAIGACFAGDFITLFVYWELTAVASAFVVWAGRTERARAAGMRYLTIQIISGVFLMAGTVVRVAETGSIAFDAIGIDGPGGLLILIAFAVKCAFPLVHNWLTDSYPEASPAGTVILSVFTTKLAIYALARGYAGAEALIWIGAVMALFPIIYAILENDLRRVIAYSLISQLGFMVAGIGIGSPLAINGAVSHAVASILYQGLLFMAIGAVCLRTGTANASALGGLARSMPWTAAFCVIGAAAISSVPLLAGFTTKSMTLSAAAEGQYIVLHLVLLAASAGAVIHSGLKVPLLAFFGADRGLRPAEAPPTMRLAMGLTAALVVAIGVWPEGLYRLLPYQAEYASYTTTHVLTVLQLVAFAALAYLFTRRFGLFPAETPGTLLDAEWSYRRAAPAVLRWFFEVGPLVWSELTGAGLTVVRAAVGLVSRHHGPTGLFGRDQALGHSVAVIITALLVILIVFYIL